MDDWATIGDGAVPSPPPAWDRAVTTEIAPLTTTGGTLWEGAGRLVDFLEAMQGPLGLHRPGLRVLELGSGVGWVGVVLARNLPHAACISVTEQECGGGLAHLRHNLALNRERNALGTLNPGLQAHACDWTLYGRERGEGWREDRDTAAQNGMEGQACDDGGNSGLAGPWDIIVGSDLVYNEAGQNMLPWVVRGLLLDSPPGTCFIYAHTKYRFEMIDVDFQKELVKAGLQCREIREPGYPTPPPSPPPLTVVFNDLRCAILEM